jgi:hypothetical protein
MRCAAALAALAALLPWSAGAQSTLVAGWDFSQYSNIFFLSIDGATLVDTLDANHSDLDPTGFGGIESNEFGTMHLDGQFGSTDTPLSFEGLDPFQPGQVPPGNSLLSNVNQAFLGFGSPAACTQGQIEQMPGANCSDFAMIAIDAVSVVFEAVRTPSVSGSWFVSFAGRTVTSGTSSVGVSFSTDGAGYGGGGTAQLTTADRAYTYVFGAPQADRVFVRFTFPSAQDPLSQPAIDNVGIAVPEPASGIGIAATLALGAIWRRRRS